MLLQYSKCMVFRWWPEIQVPHSQCSPRENPKFLKNFRPKNNTLTGNVWLLFSFYIYHPILGLTCKGKSIIYIAKLCVLGKRKSTKFTSEICEWGTRQISFQICWIKFFDNIGIWLSGKIAFLLSFVFC
jgi:hypothetical protein